MGETDLHLHCVYEVGKEDVYSWFNDRRPRQHQVYQLLQKIYPDGEKQIQNVSMYFDKQTNFSITMLCASIPDHFKLNYLILAELWLRILSQF